MVRIVNIGDRERDERSRLQLPATRKSSRWERVGSLVSKQELKQIVMGDRSAWTISSALILTVSVPAAMLGTANYV